MFFIASKIFWFLVSPLNLVALLFITALAIMSFVSWKAGYRLLIFTALLFLLPGLTSMGSLALHPLESYYERPQTKDLPDKIDGIILLGGFLKIEQSSNYGYPVYNASANRFIDFVKLLQAYPDAKAVYTGGTGLLNEAENSPYTFVQKDLKALGIEPVRVGFEFKSKNTYQNAILSKGKFDPGPDETWILVTSAFHMPRSVSVFCSADWPVIPYPTAHIQPKKVSFAPSFHFLDEYFKLDVALKEWIGIVAYRVFGKTDVLLPPPHKKESDHVTPISCA